jgi:hypothetical protein
MDNKALRKYFKIHTNDSVTFEGNELIILIPKRYEGLGILTMGESINTLGIFEMTIDGKIKKDLYLAGMIQIMPDVVETTTEDDIDFYKLTLHRGNIFMQTRKILKDKMLAFPIYKEFIYLGKKPRFMTYDRMPSMFDKVSSVTEVDFKIDPIVFEVIYAHLHRSAKDIKKFYRLTDMKEEPLLIPLSDIAHSSNSVTGKLSGSYFNQAVDSALVNKSERSSVSENILRQ